MPEFNLKNLFTVITLLVLAIGGYFLTEVVTAYAFTFFNIAASLATAAYTINFVIQKDLLNRMKFDSYGKWGISIALFAIVTAISYYSMPMLYGTSIYLTAMVLNAIPGIIMYKYIKTWLENKAEKQNAAVPYWFTLGVAIIPGIILMGILVKANVTISCINWIIAASPWIVYGLVTGLSALYYKSINAYFDGLLGKSKTIEE